MQKSFLGQDGCIWAIGVVENRKDPLFLGRAQVRWIGWDDASKVKTPTASLPWLQVATPVDSGKSVVGLKEGDYVLGFFLDAEIANEPIVWGVIPGIPETAANPSTGFFDARTSPTYPAYPFPPDATIQKTDGTGTIQINPGAISNYPVVSELKESTASRLERNENIAQTIVEQKILNVFLGQSNLIPGLHPNSSVGTDAGIVYLPFSEPTTPYNAKYPYNHVYESESGHFEEIDDTPGAERLHTYHRAGTFKEIHPSGTQVEKIVQNEYRLVLANRGTHIEGADVEVVDQGKTTKVNVDGKSDAPYTIEVGAGSNFNLTINSGNWNIFLKSGDINCRVSGDFNAKVDKNLNIEVDGDVNMLVKGNVTSNIKGSVVENITGSVARTIGGDLTETITGSRYAHIVTGNDNQTIGGDLITTSDGNIIRNAEVSIADGTVSLVHTASTIAATASESITHTAAAAITHQAPTMSHNALTLNQTATTISNTAATLTQSAAILTQAGGSLTLAGATGLLFKNTAGTWGLDSSGVTSGSIPSNISSIISTAVSAYSAITTTIAAVQSAISIATNLVRSLSSLQGLFSSAKSLFTSAASAIVSRVIASAFKGNSIPLSNSAIVTEIKKIDL